MANEIIIYEVEKTKDYKKWFDKIKNLEERYRINVRINNIINFGNFGDFKSVGDGVYELRFITKSGWRIYFSFADRKLILLLIGGDKGSQPRDIKKAKKLWEIWKNETR